MLLYQDLSEKLIKLKSDLAIARKRAVLANLLTKYSRTENIDVIELLKSLSDNEVKRKVYDIFNKLGCNIARNKLDACTLFTECLFARSIITSVQSFTECCSDIIILLGASECRLG